MLDVTENNLRQKIIKEQDILCYMWYNYFEEGAFFETIDTEIDIGYSDFDKKILASNLDIISEMSMNNLVYLVGSKNEEVKKIAHDLIMQKFRNGEHIFCGENASEEAFGFKLTTWNSFFSKMEKEDIEEIRNSVLSNLNELKEKDPNLHSLILKSNKISCIDNFFNFYEKGVITPEKIELLEKMVDENPNIFQNLNFGIFEDEIYNMGEEFVSRIAKYPNISNKVIKISKNNPELFQTIKKLFLNLEQDKRKPEFLKLEFDVLKYALKKCHDLEGASFEEILNASIRNGDSLSKIKFDYVPNYEEEFEKKCDKQFENEVRINVKKDILFNKYFGMSQHKAESFYTSYISNLQQLNLEDENLKKYLAEIERVMKIEDESEIENIYHSMSIKVTPSQRIHYEDVLREEYSKSYVEVLNSTNNKLENSKNVKYIEFCGKQIKQIELGENYNILVHSTDSGFKGAKKLVDNSFLKSWEKQEDPERHLAASCFVNQDFMGHAPVNENGVLAVFTNVQSDEINLIGPTDINSHIKSYDFCAGNSMYMTAENLPYFSRRVYNEVPKEMGRPNYFLIYDDSSDENIKNAYKAAAEFDVPVLYADKRLIVKRQLMNLDRLMEEFEKTSDLNVLQKIVSTYETNVAGWLLNRDLSEKDDSCTQQINNERFRADFDAKEKEIYSVIDKYLEENAQQIGFEEKLEQVRDIMQSEIDKYNIVDIGNTPISKTKMKFDAQGIIEKISSKIMVKSDNSLGINKSTLDLSEIAESAVVRGEVDFNVVSIEEKILNQNRDLEGERRNG